MPTLTLSIDVEDPGFSDGVVLDGSAELSIVSKDGKPERSILWKATQAWSWILGCGRSR